MDECAPAGGYLYLQGVLKAVASSNDTHLDPLRTTGSISDSTHQVPQQRAMAKALAPFLQDGDKFWRMPETYVRGNTIKYLRVPNEVRSAAAHVNA